jgi:hypothetical protein
MRPLDGRRNYRSVSKDGAGRMDAEVVSAGGRALPGGTQREKNHPFLFNGAFNQNKPKSLDQVRDFAGEHRLPPQEELSFSVADHFATQRAAIDSGEVLFHRRREERNVRDVAKIFGDEPDRLFCGHPVQMIESRQVHWT